jgi:hypothetical protein
MTLPPTPRLDALGGASVFASELDAEARAVYKLNFREEPAGDISRGRVCH